MNAKGASWRGSDSGTALLSKEERAAQRARRTARAKAERAAANQVGQGEEQGPEAMTPREMKAKMREAGFHPYSFTAKKDGTFEVRNAYFHRAGRTTESLGESIEAAAKRAGLACTILATEDHWNAWPRISSHRAHLWPRTSYQRAHFILSDLRQEEHDLIIGDRGGGLMPLPMNGREHLIAEIDSRRHQVERLVAEIDSLLHQVEAFRRKAGGINLEAASDIEEAGEYLDDARLSLLGQGLTDR